MLVCPDNPGEINNPLRDIWIPHEVNYLYLNLKHLTRRTSLLPTHLGCWLKSYWFDVCSTILFDLWTRYHCGTIYTNYLKFILQVSILKKVNKILSQKRIKRKKKHEMEMETFLDGWNTSILSHLPNSGWVVTNLNKPKISQKKKHLNKPRMGKSGNSQKG